MTDRWRIGVHDDEGDGLTRWEEFGDIADAYRVWQLLILYARPGVGFTIQRHDGEGWQTIEPPLITRPHDWNPDKK